jgi:hypothetical protein
MMLAGSLNRPGTRPKPCTPDRPQARISRGQDRRIRSAPPAARPMRHRTGNPEEAAGRRQVQGPGRLDRQRPDFHHQARHPQDLRHAAGRPRRAPPRGDAHPAAQQDQRHDGDLHRGPVRGHRRGAPQAQRTANGLTMVAAVCCCRKIKKGRFLRLEPACELGGRYWDRTSDLLGVNEALSR